jgi:ribonuclease VapC
MIVDTSAIAAILFNGPDAATYARAIADAEIRRISAATFVEASIVIEASTKAGGPREFDAFVRRAGLSIEPVTEEQAYLARQAYATYGRGRHAAGLNYGDCFPYALAKATGEPLLFKGADFRKTDVLRVL